MTVERNVVICDAEHGNHPVELVVPGMSPQFATPAAVRSEAIRRWWTVKGGEDYCPKCSWAGRDLPERGIARLRVQMILGGETPPERML